MLDGKAIHAAWRDGMLFQGRFVSDERMKWETLSAEDRALDEAIAVRLNRIARIAVPVIPRDVAAVIQAALAVKQNGVAEHFVSREMAIDAGDKSLEGTVYDREYDHHLMDDLFLALDSLTPESLAVQVGV